MSKYPSIVRLQDLIDGVKSNAASKDGNHWYPARPLGFASFQYRLKAAWLVFSGQADAVIWPEGQ